MREPETFPDYSSDAPVYERGATTPPTDAKPLVRGPYYGNASDVWTRHRGILNDDGREHFVCLYLDVRHRLIENYDCAIGSLTGVEVHPREVFRRAIVVGAAAVIFVHNHPSGDPSPSRRDTELTARLRQVGELIGIDVLDHVVVAASGYVSFANRGWL
jgi:DNA repair protein RadC